MGDQNWGHVFEAIPAEVWYGRALWFGFGIFIKVSMLNVITSFFVEDILKRGRDLEFARRERFRESEAELRKLRALVETLDADHSGQIALEELQQGLERRDVRECFERLGINTKELSRFFRTVSQVSPVDELSVEG